MTEWVAKIIAACGVAPTDARLTAEVLLRSNARGFDTHGVSRVFSYAQKLREGVVNSKPHVTSEFRNGVMHIDGDGGLGQAIVSRAIMRAVELARNTAFVPCVIRNCGHLGALGMYALQGAEAGMLVFLIQETSPVMALVGAQRAAIGNNPISFGCPIPEGDPLVFDIATSVLSRGHVLQAARDRRPIPLGWAIGPDGQPTTDAEAALAGAMLPLAGHKGIGLAMMVECLAGSLSGSVPHAIDPTRESARSGSGNLGGFFFVANPELIAGRTAFESHLRHWTTHYLASGGSKARLPGTRAAETERNRRRVGFPVPDTVLGELVRAGDLVGIPFDVEPIT